MSNGLQKKVQNKVMSNIAQYGNIPLSEIDLDTEVVNTGLDSLGVAEFIFSIEDDFGIVIEDAKDIASRLNYGTVQNVVDLVLKELESK
ncbi:hypothetical protein A9Q74_03765 [Colwellia sp. 39_35_sub15_T18]|nr:hypothetical protein A9Q74_03765 [Colwellia sp. 39_35_sub15_T18]